MCRANKRYSSKGRFLTRRIRSSWAAHRDTIGHTMIKQKANPSRNISFSRSFQCCPEGLKATSMKLRMGNFLHLLCNDTARQRNSQCMLTTTSRCKDSRRSRSIDLIISTLMLRLLKILLSLLHRQFNQYSVPGTNAAGFALVDIPCSGNLTCLNKNDQRKIWCFT